MQPGDEIGPFSFVVSREQLVRYAGASDDYNPIHYDDQAAKAFGLPGVIVHGMLNMGLIARYVLEDFPEGAWLEQYSVRFRQMVEPGHELEVRGRVRDVNEAHVSLDVQLSQDGSKAAVTGRMIIRLKEA